jgi:tyrosyl-tRNA synthetase
MDIARRNSLKRVVRCSQIMGRSESDDLSAAQIMYPVMQCADIFFLKVWGVGVGLGWAGRPCAHVLALFQSARGSSIG